jgi:RHS repeat-associated protein
VALEFNASNQLTNRYLHGPGVDMVLADEQRNASAGTLANLYWGVPDHLGSVNQLAERIGSSATVVVKERIFTVFGRLASETAPTIDSLFAFTGREFDKDADLQYNRARWYDAKQGRWMQEDPIRERAGDTNLYRYVGNAPTDATDPSGLSWFSKIFGKAKKFVQHVAGEVGKWLDKHPVIKTIVQVANVASMVFGGLQLVSGLSKLAGGTALGSKLATGARELFGGVTTAMPGSGVASTAGRIAGGSSAGLGSTSSFALPGGIAFKMDPIIVSANVISASSDASATAQALGRALATSTTSNLTTGALIGVPLAGMSLAGSGSSSALASGSASASGSLDADPNFPGSRDVDQDPSFVGRRPDLDPMTPQTPDDLDPAEVDRLATNYSLFPDQTGLPGEELKDPRERAEQTLRYHAEQQAAQNRRFKQIIEEQNQLYLNRPVRGSSSSGAGMDIALDALGTLDPTGLVDGYHSLTYAVRGQWSDAGLTAVGVIPFVGDSLKFAKYGRFADEAVSGIEAGARWGDEVAELATSSRFVSQGELATEVMGNAIDPTRFEKIRSAFVRNGGIIDQSIDAQSYLQYRQAGGLTFDAKTILLPDRPSTTAVFEEFIHATQHRTGKFSQAIDKFGNARAIDLMEVDAAEKLIRNRRAWIIPSEETRQTILRLRGLHERLGQ